MSRFSWADVADDILILLAERIVGITSFIRVSAVCKSWHMIGSATKCCYPVPWLMLAEKEGSEMRDFYDHSTREVYQLTLPQARGMKNIGFTGEWLITGSVGGPLHLLNPLSGALVHLPPLIASKNLDFDPKLLTPAKIRDTVPIRATTSPMGPNGDCIVALTHIAYRLSFCRPGDLEWTRVKLYDTFEIAYVGGAFYVVTITLQIFRVELGSIQRVTKVADLPGDVYSSISRFYIVECCGEILVVVRRYTNCWNWNIERYVTQNFRVFKLDLKGEKVVEVRGIGDYVLFLGTNDSICIPIASSSRHLLMKNCIYFTDDRYAHSNTGKFELGEDMGVFNLEDGSITPHYPGVSKSLYSFPIWVTINPLL